MLLTETPKWKVNHLQTSGIIGNHYVNYTLFSWWFCSWKITFFFFFLKRNLRHQRVECFMETLVCNFSALPDFISLQGIFSGLDLWALYIVSATKRTFCHQAHWETSCLSFCQEQMFPQHFGIILMHKMEKNRKSKEKDRHKFL